MPKLGRMLFCVTRIFLQAVCSRERRRGNKCGARSGGRAHLDFGERPQAGAPERLPREIRARPHLHGRTNARRQRQTVIPAGFVNHARVVEIARRFCVT